MSSMLYQRETWFPALDSQSVVGRVVEIEKPHGAKTREAGKPVHIIVPAMLHRVAGSDETSVTEIKATTEKELRHRFPGAIEHYEKLKAASAATPTEIVVPDGTPLNKADWIPREKLNWLEMQGFVSVEQLAALSDAQIQQLGTGSRTWKKKAAQFLAK
jgi:hypothetical protein